MLALEIALDVVLLGVCVLAAITDLRWHRIPDWLTLPALGVGLLARFAVHGFGGAFGQGLIAALLGALFCLLLFGLFAIWGKGIGGGDIKLITAVGALTGLRHAMTSVMCIALVGGVLGIALLVGRRRLLAAAGGRLRSAFVMRPDGRDRVILPYALPILMGVLWATLAKYEVLPAF